MKTLYKKINQLWLRCRKWSEISIIGDFVINTGRIVFIITIFFSIFYIITVIEIYNENKFPQLSPSNNSKSTTDNNCSVAGINLHGTIVTYIPVYSDNDSSYDDMIASERVIWAIRQANNDSKIKALVVEVDSIGGYPVAGEEVANAIKDSKKPVVGFIRETGASAAYWAISSADKIFASANSDVGSIGVTRSYLSNAEKNIKDGYVYEDLSVGKYKDSGNPDKVLTNEERALFLRDSNIIYENFIKAVSQNRKIPIEKVRKFADGSTFLGEKAKSLGLIDEIGGINEVEKYLEEITGEKPEICWQ
ncbi:MAG: signal peptide peptidase SppA [Patescibacteria group bacterium]|nr:signal peptide peptidase SppA [Patescibacteria group bacterium]